jgi:class 3 adenylate cyclase
LIANDMSLKFSGGHPRGVSYTCNLMGRAQSQYSCDLQSKSHLEGGRKQVTVLFADLKGAMGLLADRNAEQARQLLDLVLERTMEAVHRYEDTVDQVMDDGIMALFGAPVAHENQVALWKPEPV